MDVSLGSLESFHRPVFLSDRPLDEVLGIVRVQKVCSRRTRLESSWAFEFPSGPEARFAYVARGGAILNGPDESLSLTRGDFVMVAPDQRFILRHSQSSELIVGKLLLNANADVLPSIVHLKNGRSRALKATLHLMLTRAFQKGPAARLVMNRLADIVLLTALREHGEPRMRELSRSADAGLKASLHSMHETLDRRWTVADLATTAGMSRSVYAERFKTLTGESPMEYLTRRRMQKASELIREGDRTLSEIALSVGYNFDGAFHKAFRRTFGVSPGEYRRSHA